MKKTIFYLASLTLIACNHSTQPDPVVQKIKNEVNPIFPWLHGSWIIDDGETKVYESWKQENDHLLTGTSYVVAGKDTVVRELMHLQKMGDVWTFIAKVNDNNPVLFTCKQGEQDTLLVFENAEHDFPQQVIYSTGKDHGLYATIAGKEKGKERKEEYQYKRK